LPSFPADKRIVGSKIEVFMLAFAFIVMLISSSIER
jgi:hypothetical protein